MFCVCVLTLCVLCVICHRRLLSTIRSCSRRPAKNPDFTTHLSLPELSLCLHLLALESRTVFVFVFSVGVGTGLWGCGSNPRDYKLEVIHAAVSLPALLLFTGFALRLWTFIKLNKHPCTCTNVCLCDYSALHSPARHYHFATRGCQK